MKSKNSNIVAIAWIAIITIAVILLVFIGISVDEEDYARITDVYYKAVVVDEPGCEGKVMITERLTFDVHADYEDNLYWELWRDLPESYVDGVKVAFAETATYGEVKAWFLLRFPEIEEYNNNVNSLRMKIKAENEAKKELRKIA